ncbi:MAG TPA: MFS transporter [Caulobacteraceae bacterium]|nr:MFS transporter [Caulobacteraceae bacterium]
MTEVTAFEATIDPAPPTNSSFPGFTTKPYRAYVLAVLMVIYGINLLDRGLVALLQEKIKPEFHLSDFELGLLGGPAFALCNAFASLPVARLAERYNRNSVLAVCTALWSLMTALCGLVASFPLLLLARFGVGIGEAGCLPPSQSLISDYFPANRRAAAIAIHLTAIPIGGIIAGVLGGVVADLYGWRMAFIALGGPGILIALICRLTVREPPRGAGGGAATGSEATPDLRTALRELLSKRSFWHIALATGLVNFVAVGNGQYIVSFMLRVHHVTLTQVGLVLGPLVGGLTVVVGYAVGKILSALMEKDRAWLARWPAIGVAIGVPVSVAAYLTPSFPMLIVLQIVGLLCTSSYLISLYTTAQGVVQPRVRATASALVIIVINTLGYGLGPPAIGALSDFLSSHAVALGLADAAHASGQGLRYALVIGSVVNLWAAVHYFIGARRLKADWVG